MDGTVRTKSGSLPSVIRPSRLLEGPSFYDAMDGRGDLTKSKGCD
jgi:hypothetical protein